MNRVVKAAALFIGASMFGLLLGASSPVSLIPVAHGKMAPPPPIDPKKKKAGEECKSADECQKHQSCDKDGDKKVCTDPPRPRLPPGAVT